MLFEVGKFLGKLHLQTEGFKSSVKRTDFYDVSYKRVARVVKESRYQKNLKIKKAVFYLKENTSKYKLPTKRFRRMLINNCVEPEVGKHILNCAFNKVTLFLEENRAQVEVDADQFSLAVGKGGQNARLAAKLTGWKIDIIAPPGEDKREIINQE